MRRYEPIEESAPEQRVKTAMLRYRVRVVNPVYGRDPLYWEVYKDNLLVGRYRSSWEAEQCRLRIIQNGGSLKDEVVY